VLRFEYHHIAKDLRGLLGEQRVRSTASERERDEAGTVRDGKRKGWTKEIVFQVSNWRLKFIPMALWLVKTIIEKIRDGGKEGGEA